MKIQKEVIIVGAGLTGAITASYIKARFPQYRIKMIHTSTLPPYQGAQGVSSELYDYFYRNLIPNLKITCALFES